MSNKSQPKQTRFFYGMFANAEDFNNGNYYHVEKSKLHNRSLHTPGIIRGEKQELRVERVEPVEGASGLNVRVRPGAALDSEGNLIVLGESEELPIDPPDILSQPVYITIEYSEKNTDYVENVEAPQYSGHTRVTETPHLKVTTTPPNNQTSLELARIVPSSDGETSVDMDSDNPPGIEIDRRNVVWAGSVGTAEEWLPPVQQTQLIQVLQQKRRGFAALDDRFPIPSASDVRHAAITIEMLAYSGCLRSEQLPYVLDAIATIEQDVVQEIGNAYEALVSQLEFKAFQQAVTKLVVSLKGGEGIETLLSLQSAVAVAAQELSEIVLQPPAGKIANKEKLGTVHTDGETATVTLDGGGSEAYDGADIKNYGWRKTNE